MRSKWRRSRSARRGKGSIDSTVFTCIINTNSPLQLDIPMAEGLMTMAEHGQCVVVTPFTLAGAMSPVTLAGALAQQHAEAMAGIALCQIVRPGVPVMYGGFTSNVDMRSGAPAFGTPEYAQAAQASGQLARLIGVPFRSSNVTAANDVDAQAAYESMMALWGAMMGGAHLILHAAGWLGGGLTASFEKLILDAEMLQMMAAYCEPFEVSPETPGARCDARCRPGRALFRHGAYAGALRDRVLHADALELGQLRQLAWSAARETAPANGPTASGSSCSASTRSRPIDPAIDEALKDFMERRKREGGVPVN